MAGVRALLVVNPWTRSATRKVLRAVTEAFAREMKLDVELTTRRAHATELAADAVAGGFDLVIVLGGDGTLNEVVQAVAGSPLRLGVLPGGSTNVFARILGLGRDPIAAAHTLLDRLRNDQERVVNLGRANGRLFTFCAGLGYDAEVVRMVDGRPRMKRNFRQATFLYCGLLAKLAGRADVRGVTLTMPGEQPVADLGSAICCSADPYTYLGPLSARMCPQADTGLGLDLTSVNSGRLADLLRVAGTALTTDTVAHLPYVCAWHDRPSYTLSTPTPLPFHVDGEYAGAVTELTLDSVPRALTVLA